MGRTYFTELIFILAVPCVNELSNKLDLMLKADFFQPFSCLYCFAKQWKKGLFQGACINFDECFLLVVLEGV